MDADLDTLCIAVYCTADDLLPEPTGNARRMVTDAEVVTLCVAQAIMGIPSDRRFLKVARKRLAHLFPRLPAQPGYFKRRRRLADTRSSRPTALREHSSSSPPRSTNAKWASCCWSAAAAKVARPSWATRAT